MTRMRLTQKGLPRGHPVWGFSSIFHGGFSSKFLDTPSLKKWSCELDLVTTSREQNMVGVMGGDFRDEHSACSLPGITQAAILQGSRPPYCKATQEALWRSPLREERRPPAYSQVSESHVEVGSPTVKPSCDCSSGWPLVRSLMRDSEPEPTS